MPFQKGQSGNPEGKKPGTLNKVTASMKAAWEEAFAELGGKDALVQWGRREPGEFFKSVIKLIPKDVQLSGADGEPLKIVIVTGVPEKPAEEPKK